MNPLKRDKGSHKDYAYWLSTEINDYTFQTDDVDPLKQYEAVLSDTIQAQDLETDSNSINTLLQKKKPKRGPKAIKMNFTFLSNITKLPIHILVNISLFLQTKDIFGLVSSCKQLNTTFDDDNVWRTLCKKHSTQIDEERLSWVESAKDLYKYIVYRNKPGMIHHTGLFWKNGVPLASKLAQSIVDFVTPKKHAIKETLHILILRNDPSEIGNILKLSWLREENEVWLWFSSLVWIKLVESRSNEKVERLTSHVMKVYRGLDNEKIQNTFFLEDRYIVLEVVKYLKENEEEEEKNAEMIDKSASTFIIYDLENELRCLMTGEDFDEPFRYCYEESLVGIIEEKEEKNLEDNGQEGEVEANPNKALKINKNKEVKVKLLNEEEAIFYTTDEAYSWIKIVNLKTKSESSSLKVELNSPIEDIIFLKDVRLEERNSFYLIDKTLNVYQFAWTNNCLTIVKKIILQSECEEVPDQEDPIRPKDSKGFPEVCRYSQGIYQKQIKDEPNMIVEYLVVNKGQKFYFVELDTLEAHNYSPKTTYNNWTVFKDKLFLVNGSQIMIYQFSFHDFEIKEVENLKTTIKISNGFVTQAIYVDPCHTIQMICYKNPKKGGDIFEVCIGSTQFMLSAAYMKCSYNSPAYMTCPYNRYEEFEISGLLSKNRKRIIPLLAKDQFEIKFEKEGLFLKSPSRTVLFELERAKGFDRTLKSKKAYKKIDFYDMKEKKEEVKEDNQVVKEKPIINYQEIPENRNNLGKKEKQNAWSTKGEKANKEDNQEKKMIRHKGQKYRKNVQQNQRSEKYD